jgi:hypothetical protein
LYETQPIISQMGHARTSHILKIVTISTITVFFFCFFLLVLRPFGLSCFISLFHLVYLGYFFL